MKNLHLALVIPFFLGSLSSVAAEPTLKPQTQGSVTFVSGGIGSSERAELKAMRSGYNLSLQFSQRNGEFLSDVKVRITDSSDKVWLDVVSDGPQLFANLPPGSYSIAAEFGGKRFDKKLTVSNSQQPTTAFVWP